MQNFFVFSLVTLTLLSLSEGHSHNTCNYYKKGTQYWAPGRCSIGGLFGLDTTTDQKPVCKNTTTMMLEKYPLGSNCAGTPNMTSVMSGSFKCDGVQCEVGYEFTPFTSPGQPYSFTSKNCVSTNPPKIIYGVPGYCAPAPQATNIFYCGSNNNSYVQASCSSSTTATPFLEKNTCYDDGVNQRRMLTCNGGPAPPNGVTGYKTANSYTACNFFNVNGTVGVIDKCTGGFTDSYKAVCVDANTLQLSTYKGNKFCTGKATVNTYKLSASNVNFRCTGTQCLLERKIKSSCSSATTEGTNYILPGSCLKSGGVSGIWYKYYCHGTGNKSVFRERYSTSTCTAMSLNFGSAKNMTLPSCESGTDFVSCTLNGKAPPFATAKGGSSDFRVMLKVIQAVLGLCAFAIL